MMKGRFIRKLSFLVIFLILIIFVIDLADVHCNAQNAIQINVNEWITGEIEEGTEEDWFAFKANANSKYILCTELGSLVDTTLFLYDTDGQTQLGYNDDYDGLKSQIKWICLE